jgi:hypothetical protein
MVYNTQNYWVFGLAHREVQYDVTDASCVSIRL